MQPAPTESTKTETVVSGIAVQGTRRVLVINSKGVLAPSWQPGMVKRCAEPAGTRMVSLLWRGLARMVASSGVKTVMVGERENCILAFVLDLRRFRF